MRRRLIFSFLGVTTVTLLLLAIPTAYLLQNVAQDAAKDRLQRQGTYLLDGLAVAARRHQPIAEALTDALLDPDDAAVIYTGTGDVIRVHAQPVGPVISVKLNGTLGRSVVVYGSEAPVREQVRRSLLILLLLGVAGLMMTWLLAQAESRRLGTPLLHLVTAATRLGVGDFSVTAPRSGVPEFDALARTLDASASRIEALVTAERRFNTDASHQLRSALTGLRLRLEELSLTDDPERAHEANAALEQVDRLTATVGDLLKLSRTGRAGVSATFDLRALIENHIDDIQLVVRHRRRKIELKGLDSILVQAAPGAVGQALDVLLSNASVHGKGRITVELSVADAWLELTVADEGAITAEVADDVFVDKPSREGHGIGLPLARRLIEAEGGRLDMPSRQPVTFRIRLPLTRDQEPEAES